MIHDKKARFSKNPNWQKKTNTRTALIILQSKPDLVKNLSSAGRKTCPIQFLQWIGQKYPEQRGIKRYESRYLIFFLNLQLKNSKFDFQQSKLPRSFGMCRKYADIQLFKFVQKLCKLNYSVTTITNRPPNKSNTIY